MANRARPGGWQTGRRRQSAPVRPTLRATRHNPIRVPNALPSDFETDIRVTIPTNDIVINLDMAPNLESVSTATLPSASLPTASRTVEANADGLVRIQVSNTHTEGSDDDVVYLYSVSRGQLVEVVDLSENTQNQQSNSPTNRDFILSSTEEVTRTTTPGSLDGVNPSLLEELTSRGLSVSVNCSSEKNKVHTSTGEGTQKKKRKRSGEARCNVCDQNYEKITDCGDELFSSRCGHLFCMPCLKTLVPYHCTECNEKISNLWQIYV